MWYNVLYIKKSYTIKNDNRGISMKRMTLIILSITVAIVLTLSGCTKTEYVTVTDTTTLPAVTTTETTTLTTSG